MRNGQRRGSRILVSGLSSLRASSPPTASTNTTMLSMPNHDEATEGGQRSIGHFGGEEIKDQEDSTENRETGLRLRKGGHSSSGESHQE